MIGGIQSTQDSIEKILAIIEALDKGHRESSTYDDPNNSMSQTNISMLPPGGVVVFDPNCG